jgi:starvation-inducible outer membrane lipoprotein
MKVALLCVLLLAGCASIPEGIKMTGDEAKACAAQGCTVWTDAELSRLARKFWHDGFQAGVKSL